jgi:homoserine trans-succinylase
MESGNILKFTDDLEEIVIRYLSHFEALFVKPAGLSGGRGAFLIDKSTNLQILDRIHKDHAYIINNCLENEEYAKKINPFSLNTLRAYFYRHKTDGLKFQIILHRFGTANEWMC